MATHQLREMIGVPIGCYMVEALEAGGNGVLVGTLSDKVPRDPVVNQECVVFCIVGVGGLAAQRRVEVGWDAALRVESRRQRERKKSRKKTSKHRLLKVFPLILLYILSFSLPECDTYFSVD